jgi:hypothetical protein
VNIFVRSDCRVVSERLRANSFGAAAMRRRGAVARGRTLRIVPAELGAEEGLVGLARWLRALIEHQPHAARGLRNADREPEDVTLRVLEVATADVVSLATRRSRICSTGTASRRLVGYHRHNEACAAEVLERLRREAGRARLDAGLPGVNDPGRG